MIALLGNSIIDNPCLLASIMSFQRVASPATPPLTSDMHSNNQLIKLNLHLEKELGISTFSGLKFDCHLFCGGLRGFCPTLFSGSIANC